MNAETNVLPTRKVGLQSINNSDLLVKPLSWSDQGVDDTQEEIAQLVSECQSLNEKLKAAQNSSYEYSVRSGTYDLVTLIVAIVATCLILRASLVVMVAVSSIFGLSTICLMLLRKARLSERPIMSRVAFYASAFVLLSELVILCDRLDHIIMSAAGCPH